MDNQNNTINSVTENNLSTNPPISQRLPQPTIFAASAPKRQFGYGKLSNFIIWILLSFVLMMVLGWFMRIVERSISSPILTYIPYAILIFFYAVRNLGHQKSAKNQKISFEDGLNAINFSAYGLMTGIAVQIVLALCILIFEMNNIIARSSEYVQEAARGVYDELIIRAAVNIVIILGLIFVVRFFIARRLKKSRAQK